MATIQHLVGTNKIKDEWQKINANFDALNAENNGWRIYNDITELGLTPGTETMEAICAALPDRSELRYIKVTSNPSTAYPASSGMLIIRKYTVYRIELRFINGFSNDANEWVGYYDVNVTPNFTGWIKLARTSELTPYESGLWTPDLKFGGGNVDITYSYRYGRYVRIGNVVHWWVDIFLTSKGTATGAATIEGLPFPAASGSPTVTSVGVTGNVTYPTNATGVHFTVLNGESRLTIRCFGSNIVSTTALTDANFSNSSTIRAEGKYYI